MEDKELLKLKDRLSNLKTLIIQTTTRKEEAKNKIAEYQTELSALMPGIDVKDSEAVNKFIKELEDGLRERAKLIEDFSKEVEVALNVLQNNSK